MTVTATVEDYFSFEQRRNRPDYKETFEVYHALSNQKRNRD